MLSRVMESFLKPLVFFLTYPSGKKVFWKGLINGEALLDWLDSTDIEAL